MHPGVSCVLLSGFFGPDLDPFPLQAPSFRRLITITMHLYHFGCVCLVHVWSGRESEKLLYLTAEIPSYVCY